MRGAGISLSIPQTSPPFLLACIVSPALGLPILPRRGGGARHSLGAKRLPHYQVAYRCVPSPFLFSRLVGLAGQWWDVHAPHSASACLSQRTNEPTPPTDTRYALVGDSPDNSSAQFRATRQFDDGIPTYTASVPSNDGASHTVTLLKIEPVTFDGFFPASIGRNPLSLHVGQTLTVAGYGRSDVSNTGGGHPLGAHEARLRVESVGDDAFLAQNPGAGPCVGACETAIKYNIPPLGLGSDPLIRALTFFSCACLPQATAGCRFSTKAPCHCLASG
jgi:hypothetical protein